MSDDLRQSSAPERRGRATSRPRVASSDLLAKDLLLRLTPTIQLDSRPAANATAFLEELSRCSGLKGWLVSWSPEGREAAWVPSGASEPFPLELGMDAGGLLRRALEDNRPVIVREQGDSANAPERRFLRLGEGGGWAFLPLALAGRVTGALVLKAASRGHLSGRSTAAIEAVLPLATSIVRSCLARDQMDARFEERTSELALLYEMSRSLGFSVRPEEVVQRIASSLRTVLDARLCAFSIPAQGGEELRLHLSSEVGGLVLEDLRAQVSGELARLTGACPERTDVHVQPGEPGGGPVSFGEIGPPSHVPLLARGEVLGLLTVFPRAGTDFGEGAMRLLYTIANQASQTLDRLRTSQQAEDDKIHSMLDSMADGVILLDGRLRPVMLNPAARAYLSILGGRRDEGEPLERLGGIRLDATLREMDPTDTGPKVFETSVQGRTFSVTCSPVNLGDEAPGMVVVLSDITKARSLQEQLAQNEKLAAMGRVIGGVAHELNSPLASVVLGAQLLQREDVSGEVRTRVTFIVDEAERCQRVVQDLLYRAHPHRVLDLNEAIGSVAEILRHQLEKDRIVLELDLQRGLRRVLGDGHSLRQVLINIVQNAQHAMAGRGSGRVFVRTRGDERTVRVEVIDDGPGIPSEYLSRVFEPFFTTKEVGKGTGLGLNLAYQTVEKHGGSIKAENPPGGGALFTIELPAHEGDDEAREEESREAGQGSGGGGHGMPPVRERGGRILVVEDEKPLADVMIEALQLQGHVIDAAGDGKTALSMIGSGDYDVIITDLKMPNMGGREFYAHVAKARPELARRIIFSTGDTANPETRAFFREVGNPCLRKPFNLADLLRLVDSVSDQA